MKGPTVTLKRIFHRDAMRIAICFAYDERLKGIAKLIPGIKYSNSHKCFYVDDSEENLKIILSQFSGSAYVNTGQLTAQVSNNEEVTAKRIPTNRDKKSEHLVTGRRSVEFRINENDGRFMVRLPIPYSPEWVSELKSFMGSRYDNVRREWTIPWSKMTTDSLADYFSHEGINVDIRKDNIEEALLLERKTKGDIIRERTIDNKVIEGLNNMSVYLEEKRYSPKTIETYSSMMEFVFKYFAGKDPEKITGEEISGFIYDFIIKLGYSAAYQNQMLSAIKTYYSVAGRDQLILKIPGRPRRGRALPKIFSKEEIGRILNSSGNIKHKLLLCLIYSCGLRRSEVTNIKLKDLDRGRGIIHIREGKGMVDRIVPVPVKVWQKIDEYMAGYSPRTYLFEGQTGGKYSSESVYMVFKSALKKCGICKDVGVHSLRHSYATHLHENGLDIKYIQELLGHRSTKTTEIYTHVSRRNLISVRSPIEDIDVK